tara:strand:+ start:768 stop:1400 length:633 start_codon:yes stop_codon:yes gene_type:complete
MKKAIIMKGPSGVGKSSVSSLICKNHNYKHCDADEFKWLFSHKRSKERTKIGEYICYVYTKELIKRGYNIVIEATPGDYIKKRLSYFKSKKRLERIRKNVDNLILIEGNILDVESCKDYSDFTKIYLSNILEYYNNTSLFNGEDCSSILDLLSKKGLIYVTSYHEEIMNKKILLNNSLTQKSKEYYKNLNSGWNPNIYEKVSEDTLIVNI